jgi:hypothetical protein
MRRDRPSGQDASRSNLRSCNVEEHRASKNHVLYTVHDYPHDVHHAV